MAYVVRTPAPGARGIDTDTRITAATAKAIAEWRDPTDGSAITFVLRYKAFSGAKDTRNDLDAIELADITQAGLLVGVIQHVREPPWSPSGTRGSADGLALVAGARAIGLPEGMTLSYDMEGPAQTAGIQAILDFDGEFCPVVKSSFVPGGYFGYGVPLTANQMWGLGVEGYHRAGGAAPPDPLHCGYYMRQLLPFNQELCGIKVDFDVVQPDGLGRLPGFAAWA